MAELIKPANFSKAQIEILANRFAEKINYNPQENNLISCVNGLGGHIKYDDTKIDSIGGSIDVYDENNFVIYLSPYTSEKRDVFTIAHELGHYVLHSRLGAVKLKANRDDSKNLAERESNLFAAEFLMPKEDVNKQYSSGKTTINQLAKYFNVSISAMTWRCKNLGLI